MPERVSCPVDHVFEEDDVVVAFVSSVEKGIQRATVGDLVNHRVCVGGGDEVSSLAEECRHPMAGNGGEDVQVWEITPQRVPT